MPNADELARFITEIHGQEFKGEMWWATTDYDGEEPAVAFTPQQMSAVTRAKQEAEMEREQCERRLRRETRALDEALLLGMALADMEKTSRS